jgi:phenylpyruvate tautomerase PptA (4-oxalocrotonate tautomerase family)
MPYLKLTTNKPINDEQAPELMSRLSKLVANETGKPERYVMIELEGEKAMLFAGTPDPLAFLECKSIGLSGRQAKSLASSLSRTLETSLSIPSDRIYIEFSNCPADFWGWNGSTFG